jgi:hypothetical protein
LEHPRSDVDVRCHTFEKKGLLVGRQVAIAMPGIFGKGSVGYTLAVRDRAIHKIRIEQMGLSNALVNEWLDQFQEEWN